MKRTAILCLCLCVLLCSCTQVQSQTEKQYTATFLTLFDTVTTIVGFAESEEAFQRQAQTIHDELLRYHRLFDIYNDYEGLNNLKTVNDQAGNAPVTVDPAVIALLRDCAAYYELTDGRVNAAMGSVLRLWHETRSEALQDPRQARLPDPATLREAAEHMDPGCIVIDAEASTVYITDPLCALDVGAIAKGWAAQRVAEQAPVGMLISVGGNVCATGPKRGDNPWVIGIQDPDGDGNLHAIYVTGGAVVTSGDYQRTYTVDGTRYHHIIDPDTGMPANYWRSVTVVHADSALADALSTGLFLLPLEQGRELAESCGAEVLWIDGQGEETMTPGFQKIIRT